MKKVFIDNETVSKAKQFDEDALASIFENFKPIIKAIGKNYFIRGGDSDDIVQEAMIALFGAIKNYDEKKSDEFVLFALRCINLRLKSAVKGSLRKKHTPLNESVEIDESCLPEYLNTYPDPEDSYIENESYRQISENVKKVLSDFEFKVFINYIESR